MKICFLCYHLSDGGAQRVVSVLSGDLARRHEVLIVVKERCEKEYQLDPGVRIRVMDDDLAFRASGHKDVAAVGLLRRIYREEKPDYVLNFLGFTEAGYLASLGLKTKYVTTIRNSPWSKPESKLRRFTRDLTVMLSPACMIQNREQGTYFPGWMGKKLFVIHNPVDPVYVDHGPRSYGPVKKIITLGRLHDQKNHGMLIRAFSRIAREAPEVSLEIYGDGSKKEKLQQLIGDLALQDRVRILPFQTDPVPVYDSGDLFVLSSNFEGSPNALLEAMAVGLPCISTDCRTGPKEIIREGENGCLVPVGDEAMLAEKMLRLIQDPDLCRRMGTAARETILQQYTLEQVSGELEKQLSCRMK